MKTFCPDLLSGVNSFSTDGTSDYQKRESLHTPSEVHFLGTEHQDGRLDGALVSMKGEGRTDTPNSFMKVSMHQTRG